MGDAGPAPATRGPSHTVYLLGRIAEEVERAQRLEDPLEQAKVLAQLVQPYAGWALREAVMDCRERGMSWAAVGQGIGLSQAVLSRQARANGPVVTITPYYGPGSRNADGQTPLRLAATNLVRRTLDLAAHAPEASTAGHLYIAVMAMAQAQAANQAEPLLRTVDEVIRIADAIEADVRSGQSASEGEVWEALEELRAAYERDQGTIRVAAELSTLPDKGEA